MESHAKKPRRRFFSGTAVIIVAFALLVAATDGSRGADAITDAASRGDERAISSALDSGADINARDGKGWTPLIHAISEGRTAAAMLLIDRGADINATTTLGYTPLHFAGGCGNPTLVRALLDRGARIDVTAEDVRNTPLNMAVRGGSAKVIRLFLDHHADPNASQDIYGDTPLTLAANRGFNAIVETLLAAGADVNKSQNEGWTPLMCAALKGRLETVKLLLKNGADAKLRKSDRGTALDCAEQNENFRFEHFEIKELLYAAMTGKSRRQLIEDFHRAIRKGDNAAVARMCNDPAIYADERSEGVLVAAAAGNAKAAQLLIDADAGTTLGNAAGFPPILYAAIRGDAELVRLLLDNHAEVNASNREGLTPLMAAARKGSLPVVKLLLASKSEPSMRDIQGRTALDFAVENGSVEIEKALRAAAPVVQYSRIRNSLIDPSRREDDVPEKSPRAPGPVSQRLVLAPFTSADNSYASTAAGADLALLLQTTDSLKDMQWVERSELDKARDELAHGLMNSPGSVDSLRLGKWLGADFVVMGRFGIDSGAGRLLTVEVVDVRRADVLARFSLPVKGELGMPLRIAAGDVDRIARLLAAALAESAAALARSDELTTVAPLFFRNVSATGDRLDFLEDEVMEAFRQAGDSRTRILRFPGATVAADEHDLALSGLADRDDDAWKNVADVYVWGSFEEVDSEGVPFDRVKVRVDLEAWNGSGQTQKTSEVFELAEAATALPKLVRKVIQQQAPPAGPAAEGTTSKQVAQTLLQRVSELQAAETDQFEASKRSLPWLRRLDFRTKLLELARFFDPGDAGINRQLLVEQWFMHFPRENLGGRTVTNPFEVLWKCCEAWGAHVDRFGLASLDEIPTDPVTMRKLPGSVSTGEVAKHPHQSGFVIMPCDFARTISYHDSDEGFPDDVPPSVSREWKRHFLEELLRRLRLVADEEPERFGLRLFQFFPTGDDSTEGLIDDPQLRADICSTAWKLSREEKMTGEDRMKCLRGLQVIMAAAGREAGTDQLLAAESGPQVGYPGYTLSNTDRDEEKRKIEARNTALLDRKDLAPGEIAATFTINSLQEDKEHVWGIDVSLLDGTTLWAVVQVIGPNGSNSGQVWSYETSKKQTKPYGGLTESGSQRITSMHRHGRELWVGTDGAGVWRLDTNANVITKFDAGSGLPSPYMRAGAGTEREIFFGGGDETAGKIGAFDFARQAWTNIGPIGGPGQARPVVNRLAANAEWLLAYSKGQYGEDPSYFDLFNTRSRTWMPVAPLPLATVRFHPSLVADASGFWIGGGSTLHHLALPAGGKPASAAQVGIPVEGEITAMADDGDYLWVAAAVLNMQPGYLWECTTRLYRLHKADGSLSGFARVPYNGPVVSIGVAADALWLGLDTRYDTPVNLLRMPKDSFSKASP